MLVSAGGSGWCLPSPCQWHSGPVCRCEASEGRQQVHLPQPGGRGVPPAGVLLAALPGLQAAPHLQGTASLVMGKHGDSAGPAVAVWLITQEQSPASASPSIMGVLFACHPEDVFSPGVLVRSHPNPRYCVFWAVLKAVPSACQYLWL